MVNRSFRLPDHAAPSPQQWPRTVASWLALVCFALLSVGDAVAHALPVNTMVNALVRVQGTRADMVARVPMDLLRGVPFPTAAGDYDLARCGPYLELARILLADSLVLAENGARLSVLESHVRIVAASDRSFDSFQHALASMRSPSQQGASIRHDTGYLDVHFVYAVASALSRFEIQSHVAVDVDVLAPLTIRFARDNQAGSAMLVAGGSGAVDLDPTWYRAAAGFAKLGVEHILSGADHLLFLLCIVVPVRRVRDTVPLITAFTLAHSATLIASALGLAPRGAWFTPLVEAGIAASIVYTALENILKSSIGRRWLITCLFGLVHGFGFSNALGDSLQLAGQHLILSLLAFNAGIELGQLGVLCLVLPLLALLRRWIAPRNLVVCLSGLGGFLGAVWLVERWEALWNANGPCTGAACVDPMAPRLMLGAAFVLTVLVIYCVRSSRSIAAPCQHGEAP